MGVYVDDPDFTLHVGDVRDELANLPDESVHCVVTSPPYWGLRDYGTGSWDGGDQGCDHKRQDAREPHERRSSTLGGGTDTIRIQEEANVYRDVCGKCGARRVDRQLGLEATPDEYVANMVAVFREVRRVLRRDGTCWVNLGDTYNSRLDGSHGGWNGSTPEPQTVDDRGPTNSWQGTVGRLAQKNLLGMPWRVAFALQADGWILRSDIVWAKPNPMPESVTDRPTKAHEYVFLLTRSPRYFFDQEAVREPHTPDGRSVTTVHQGNGSIQHRDGERWPNGGRNVRSVWEIATQPYPEAHFATFPEELARRCILAGTSERGVCPECGAPWERVTEETSENAAWKARENGWAKRSGDLEQGRGTAGTGTNSASVPPKVSTTGWRPSCICGTGRGPDHVYPEPVPARVLDPFMGSGTTAHVARKLGRRSIGVELNPEYAALCARRLQQLSLLA